MRRRFISRAIPSQARINALQFRSKRLRASGGSFLLTGRDADLHLANGIILAAGAGSFSLAGQSASLLLSKVLAAGAGAFSLAGQAASFVLGKGLVADPGAFALTGQAAALLANHSVVAGVGAFALTGQTAGLLRGQLVSAQPGAFALSGQDAGFVLGKSIAAGAGAFALSGQAATLLASHRVAADAGAFALTGQAATLTKPTFATVAATNTSFAAAGGSTMTVDLPSGVVNGSLCLIFVTGGSGTDKDYSISGWTQLGENTVAASAATTAIFYRFCDGSEGATVSCTWTGGTQAGSAISVRLSGHHTSAPPEVSAAASASTTTPNPASLTATWGAANNLWLVYVGCRSTVDDFVSYPTNYASDQIAWDMGSTRTRFASRTTAAATEDPGAFAWTAAKNSTAWTVAIRPA